MRTQRQADRDDVILWARHLVEHGNFVILDTETTGLNIYSDEPVQIGIIDSTGNTLLDTLVKPRCPIGSQAAAVHGITAKRLTDAPDFADVYPQIFAAVNGHVGVVYNMEYDILLLNRTVSRRGITESSDTLRFLFGALSWQCAMVTYAAFVGERRGGSYRYQPLPGGDHSAVGDCRATLELIQRMADSETTEEGKREVYELGGGER